jgi:hypothetical protein
VDPQKLPLAVEKGKGTSFFPLYILKMAGGFTKDNLKEVAGPLFSIGCFWPTRELSP